jgi:pimeloyl-ACP methyl ester carboxylesterase
LGVLAVALAGCTSAVSSRSEHKSLVDYPPEGQILDVGGVPVHVVVQGAGPDVVLVHGASGNTRDFTMSLVDRLSDRYRVIVFDRPGLGYTGHTRPEYARVTATTSDTPAEQAALLSAAARQLGADAPLVVGQSYGGAVALAWALDQPLSGLVTLAGVSNVWPGPLDAIYRINSSRLGALTTVPLLSAFTPQSRIESTLETIFAPNPVPQGYTAAIGIPLALRPISLRANARQINSLKPHIATMVPRYGTITVPTEILHGDADTIVPLAIHSAKLVDQIPGARLQVLEGIGHMPHHAAPQAVVAAIDRAATRAGLR